MVTRNHRPKSLPKCLSFCPHPKPNLFDSAPIFRAPKSNQLTQCSGPVSSRFLSSYWFSARNRQDAVGMKLGIPSKETTREGHSLIPFLSNQPILRDRVAPGRCGTPPPARTPSQWQEPRRCRPPAASPEIESQASAENPPLGITKVIFQHLAVVLRDPPPILLGFEWK